MGAIRKRLSAGASKGVQGSERTPLSENVPVSRLRIQPEHRVWLLFKETAVRYTKATSHQQIKATGEQISLHNLKNRGNMLIFFKAKIGFEKHMPIDNTFCYCISYSRIYTKSSLHCHTVCIAWEDSVILPTNEIHNKRGRGKLLGEHLIKKDILRYPLKSIQ